MCSVRFHPQIPVRVGVANHWIQPIIVNVTPSVLSTAIAAVIILHSVPAEVREVVQPVSPSSAVFL